MARSSFSALLAVVVAMTVAATISASTPDSADESIRQFLAHDHTQPAYRAARRLEAENGNQKGWMEAITEYSDDGGFRYTITAEGGSSSIRTKVLRAVLDGERELIAHGDMARSSLVPANYSFQPNGIDDHGLANVLLSPRRKERELVSGRMFLQPADGRLVRVEGRLSKSPSFWIKNVDIVRTYQRIHGVVVPVALESNADVRFLGGATFHMTYTYSHVNRQPVTPT